MKIKRILLLLFNCFALHTHGIENPHDYPVELYELAYQLQCDTGVVVIAYNRPDYFQKVVDALEKIVKRTISFCFHFGRRSKCHTSRKH